MKNIEKFAELKRLCSLKSEYHKLEFESSVEKVKTRLDGNGVISNVIKVTTGAIGLYSTFNKSTEEKNTNQ